jgi:hypothetical protein
MKRVIVNLLLASSLLGSASYVSASLPSRDGLVALACEPNIRAAPLLSSHPKFRESSRKRYVFMNRSSTGEITKLCTDEIATDKTEPTTCRSDVLSGSSKVSTESAYGYGFREITVFRKDASMVLRQYDDDGGQIQRYSCTPSKDPGAILDYVINQKRTQRSQNAF